MTSLDEQNKINRDNNQQKEADSQHYRQIEIQLLKAIYDSAKDGRQVTSINELLSILSTFDPFTLRRQILTLEGKGFIKKSECGYILTEKGKERLQNFYNYEGAVTA